MAIDFTPVRINFYNEEGKRTTTTINYSIVAFWAIAFGYGNDISSVAKNHSVVMRDLQKLINDNKRDWHYKFIIEFNILTLARNKIINEILRYNCFSK